MATDEALFNPLTPEFHANPYPFYQRLRETDPVHLSPLGLWILTRYEDCVTSLRDPRFGRDGRDAGYLTVRTPCIPAAAWPGTVHRNL